MLVMDENTCKARFVYSEELFSMVRTFGESQFANVKVPTKRFEYWSEGITEDGRVTREDNKRLVPTDCTFYNLSIYVHRYDGTICLNDEHSLAKETIYLLGIIKFAGKTQGYRVIHYLDHGVELKDFRAQELIDLIGNSKVNLINAHVETRGNMQYIKSNKVATHWNIEWIPERKDKVTKDKSSDDSVEFVESTTKI